MEGNESTTPAPGTMARLASRHQQRRMTPTSPTRRCVNGAIDQRHPNTAASHNVTRVVEDGAVASVLLGAEAVQLASIIRASAPTWDYADLMRRGSRLVARADSDGPVIVAWRRAPHQLMSVRLVRTLVTDQSEALMGLVDERHLTLARSWPPRPCAVAGRGHRWSALAKRGRTILTPPGPAKDDAPHSGHPRHDTTQDRPRR
jgi:hypothetical protein